MDNEKLTRGRRKKILKVAKENGFEALLVANYDTFRYITGIQPLYSADFSIDAYAVVLSKTGDAVVSSYYLEEQPTWLARIIPPPIFVPAPLVASTWAEIYSDALKTLNITRGVVGIDYLTFDVLVELQKKMPKVKFAQASAHILKTRATKTDEEIELVKEAARVVDIGATAGLDAIEVGISENELAGRMILAMAKEGVEGIPWLPTVRSGDRTLKGMFPTDRKFRKGDAVVFDTGCVATGGYVGDISRTGFVGKPSDEMKELYVALYRAYMKAIKSVKPGVMASEIDRVCREALAAEACPVYERATGHGLGLRALELPWITRHEEVGDKDMELEKGMILSIEPVTHRNGVCGVKLEDMILVTDSGYDILTKTKFF